MNQQLGKLDNAELAELYAKKSATYNNVELTINMVYARILANYAIYDHREKPITEIDKLPKAHADCRNDVEAFYREGWSIINQLDVMPEGCTNLVDVYRPVGEIEDEIVDRVEKVLGRTIKDRDSVVAKFIENFTDREVPVLSERTNGRLI